MNLSDFRIKIYISSNCHLNSFLIHPNKIVNITTIIGLLKWFTPSLSTINILSWKRSDKGPTFYIPASLFSLFAEKSILLIGIITYVVSIIYDFL